MYILLIIINLLTLKTYNYETKKTFPPSSWPPQRFEDNTWRTTTMIQCLHPVHLRDPTRIPSEFDVPCGKCALCLSRRRAMWSFRLRQELLNSTSGYFITLTYNEENCPEKCEKEHIEKFLKRFRRRIEPNRVRYFLVCEYGGKFLRPHYHLLLFNFIGDREYLRSVLKTTWTYCDSFMFDYGDTVGDIEMASINYVCKYCLSTLDDDSSNLPIFISCSRHPYIGEGYISDNIRHYVRRRFDGCTILQGEKIPLPRCYMDKIFTQPERELIALQKYKQNIKKQLKQYGMKGSELMPYLESDLEIPEKEQKLFRDRLKDKERKIKSKLK